MGYLDPLPTGREVDDLAEEDLESELASSEREACPGYDVLGSALQQLPPQRPRRGGATRVRRYPGATKPVS
jgi:hypothetical protein